MLVLDVPTGVVVAVFIGLLACVVWAERHVGIHVQRRDALRS